ncbi:MAG: uracil-DNA glycosylase [Verrucomicrobia bacterium]|nr:uracil-DNA glycosylase [Verrucomicrobiota bacterium]
MRPADAVIDFLEAEQARGVSHIFLDEGARDGLRAWFRRSTQSPPAARIAPSSPEAVVEPPAHPAKPAAPPLQVTAEGASKAERLASLLDTLRETMVFATGNPDARVMLVGEAPGYEKEKKGEPFVGPAGQKLDDILKAMGLFRREVYISNIVKFRPATARQTTNNRKPSPVEMAACLPFIHAEIGIVRPACIIAMGGTAAEGLLGLTGTVTSMRGLWHDFKGIRVRVTYHPSYLLQSGANLSIKRQVWEDMLAVMEELGMPISARQRGFFLPKS